MTSALVRAFLWLAIGLNLVRWRKHEAGQDPSLKNQYFKLETPVVYDYGQPRRAFSHGIYSKLDVLGGAR